MTARFLPTIPGADTACLHAGREENSSGLGEYPAPPGEGYRPRPRRRARATRRLAASCAVAVLVLAADGARAQEARAPGKSPLPVKIGSGEGEVGGISLSRPVEILLLLTALSFLPAFLVMVTGFTRIVVVLSLLRQALSVQQVPPNIVLIGLSLFLTAFLMNPVWKKVHAESIAPYQAGEIKTMEAVDKGLGPLREFMGRQTRQQDLALLLDIREMPAPDTFDAVPTHVLVPAFVLSELRTAFRMGFLLFLPFLVIDLVVASVLMSMGMMMLPPVMVSLPFKLLLFVLVDGWALVVRSIMLSF